MIRNFFSRLMYGRYGTDQLNIFLSIFFLLLWVIELFVRNQIALAILQGISTICVFFVFFRTFSRNYSRRHSENEAFLKLVGPGLHWFRRKRNQTKDREHVYFKCPSCKQVLRVPREKAKLPSPAATAEPCFRRKPDFKTECCYR